MSHTSHPPPARFDALDHQLFTAWSSGDEDARADAWLLMHQYLTSLALSICGRSAADRAQALQWADEAMTDAWNEVDGRLRAGHVWEGEHRFVGLVRSRVVFHSLRRCETGLRWNARVRSVPEGGDGDETFDRLQSLRPDQGRREIAVDTTGEHVAGLIARLDRLRELAWNRPALKAVLDSSLAYVRECCERAVPDTVGKSAPLLQLIPRLDRDAFEASEAEMNQFIMERLNIGRNVLDLRRQQIRKLAAG